MFPDRAAYVRATPQQVETARLQLCSLLMALQGLQMLYQHAGWVTGAGPNGPSNLYERLAGEISWEATGLAGKIVGYFGSECLSLQTSLRGIQMSIARWEALEGTSPSGRALLAEADIQYLLSSTDKKIRAANAMSLGLSLFLKTMADKHEGNTLALQQSVTVRVASGTAEHLFHDNPEKREVQQLVRGPLPPTPVDIKKGPGGEGVSTLNRFVVESLDPRTAPAGPANHIRKPE